MKIEFEVVWVFNMREIICSFSCHYVALKSSFPSIQKLDDQERQESRHSWLLSYFDFWSFYDSTMIFNFMCFATFVDATFVDANLVDAIFAIFSAF